MKSLLLTLGHNSSAIFVDEDYVIGYEEERLTGVKTDSQFPNNAIGEIIKNVGIKRVKGSKVYISHWFDFNNTIPNKYITQTDIDNLKEISEDIQFVNEQFTHHDAHAYSGLAFFKYHAAKNHLKLYADDKIHILVADGFGNNGEVLSVYELEDMKPKLLHRVFGYNNSIGLMYQYATSYVGMKENQDEYKFLGYESHIDEYLNENQIEELNSYISQLVNRLWDGFLRCTDQERNYKITENVINFDALKETKQYFHNIFDTAYKFVWREQNKEKYNDEENEFIQRCIVAYYLQQTVEKFFGKVIEKFKINNAIVVGGSFYNVKLNNYIFENTKGYYCAMPLAGDQGAAIGLYEKFSGEQFPFDTLCIGKRNFYNADKFFGKNFYREGTDELAREIAQKISNGYIIDLVHGSMEFGPRALCDTSSIFIPSTKNTAQNNSNNLRNEVMPCAPICTLDNAYKLFGKENIDRVVGSDEFMILTHNYKKDYSELYGGVMHKKTLENIYTGRPQIVREGTFEYKILKYVEEICDIKCLVNTSFNKHGTPILFNNKQIKDDYNFQVEHSKLAGYEKHPLLYVVED